MVVKQLQELKKGEVWEERGWILRAEELVEVRRENEAGKVEKVEEEEEGAERRLVCMEEVRVAIV